MQRIYINLRNFIAAKEHKGRKEWFFKASAFVFFVFSRGYGFV
jgi:hypothetical protein